MGFFALALGIVISSFSTNAQAFSVSPQYYSLKAFQLILGSADVTKALPTGKAITSIEQVAGAKEYRFEVKAGDCTVTVDLDTSTPRGFIGNGFPHDPKVVDTENCN